MRSINRIIDYLIQEKLKLATAESCTAGEITSMLAKCNQCGHCVLIGYVVYSLDAKKKHLGVKQETIAQYTLTSEQVAREMVLGVFKHNKVDVVIATTGITGDEPMDGVPAGTICFAWGFKKGKNVFLFSETKNFEESRERLPRKAGKYALKKVIDLHKSLKTKVNN